MAVKTKEAALFKSIKKGNAANVRELLEAGASIEARDLNDKTPVMIAAQAGHLESFQTLVEHGADLKVIAFKNTDLLECAAEGGNVEIIRFLIDKGMPLEGRWRPRSDSGKRMGHITALQMAAMNGHVDAVRVLLEAGADRSAKFDGMTALKRAEDDIKHPIGDQAQLKPQFLEIVRLLTESGKNDVKPSVDLNLEVAKFAENARQPACVKLRARLEKLCGSARNWKPVPDHGIAAKGVVAFKLKACSQKTHEQLVKEAAKAGCHLVLSELWMPDEDAHLVLFPTDNIFAVITAVGTEGVNENVSTENVIECLTSVNQSNPFRLEYCSHDLVGGSFRQPLKGVTKLAEQFIELCPDLLDDETGGVKEFAAELKYQNSFLLWWG